MSNSDESTATNITLVSNKSEKLKRRKWNQTEYELIGDFLLNLYHRQVFTKNKHEFSVLRKEETLKEFLTFSKTAKVGEKFEKLSDVDNFGALLQNTGFLVESSDKSPFFKLKSSTLIRYRKNKLEKLDKLRINLDITDGQPSKSIDKENNAGTIDEIDESSQAYQLQYQGTTLQERNNDFCLTNTGCGICQENFETMSAFEEHIQKHSDDSDFEFLNSLTKFESPTFSMHYKFCKDSHKLCITFVSTTKDNLVIERIILVQTRSVIYALNLKVPYEMPAEGHDNFYVDSHLFTLHMEYPIVLVCHLKESKEIRIVEEHHLTISHELPSIKFGYNPNHIPKAKPFQPKIKLLPYLPPKKVEDALSDDFFCEALMKNSKEFQEYIKNDKILQLSTYASSLTTLLQIEDVDTIKEYDKLTQQNVVVNSCGDDYSLKLKGKNVFIENILSPVDNVIIKGAGKTYTGIITAVNVNRVSFCRDDQIIPLKAANETAKAKYTVSFRPSRFSIRHQYRALTLLSSNMRKFQRFLFPSDVDPLPAAHLSLDLYNKHIKHNPEQFQAVCNIVQGPRRDATYIIFGPPGTGKTTTVVEAILQLLKKPNTKILAVASSNAACDEVALRLCQALEPLNLRRTIARIYARSFEKRVDFIDDLLLDHSNMYDSHFFPCVDVLHMYRIVVCTLSIVAKLATGRFGKGITHIFIDEVAACTETEALLAIVNIANDASSLIISGDHKQLGPILQSTRSENLGLGVSLMDRLMERECYRCNADTGDYNRSIQTRLRLNFRSHPEIVNLFSGLYYNHTLEAKSNITDVDLAKKWHQTPNHEYPIIFHSVKGFCERDRQSVSLFNLVELNVVMDYVKDFLYYGINGEPVNEADIGIISPYKKQYQCIQEQLNLRKWFKIETGAVESFQGREKPIIIVSFVRSRTETLGFLKNPRRLNVTISRAKSLLILIGNAQTLSMNEDFAHIIDMCRRHGSFRGEEFKKNPNKSFLKSMEDLTLEEQQQFNIKRVTNNGRYAFVKKTGFGKHNAVAGKGEGEVIEQAKNNNSNINARRRSKRSGYERRQRNVKSVNVSKDGAKSVEKQSKLNVTNVERLFNELPKVPQLVKSAENNASKGMNSVKTSHPHTSHLNFLPVANPFIGMTNNNVSFNNQGFYNAYTFQMPSMGNGSSQMRAAGNGSSQMRLTGNQPFQSRPMLNGLSQMQSTGNGPPQMRPRSDISSQMRPMGNVPQQMWPKCNVPSQTGHIFNGFSQMPSMGNGPQTRPMFNAPSQMPGNNPSSTVNNSNFHGSSIPSMSDKIKYDKTALLDIRKKITTTTVARKADKHQTSNSLTDSHNLCYEKHKNSKHTQSSSNTDSSTSTSNLLAKTSAKQSRKQSSSPISDTVKNNKTATSSCGATVAETATAVSAVRQTMISTTPSSQQDKPNTSTDRKSSSNDPASPPVKSDILTNLSIQQSNLTNNTSCSASTASSNRPLDGNTTTSHSTARSGSAGSTSNYSGNPLISKPTTTNSAVLTAATASSQLASKRQSSPVVCITTSSEATNHRGTYAHTSAELTSNRALINPTYSQRFPVACITTRSEASNHRTNYTYTSAELSSNRGAYSPQHVYYETVTRPESNLRSSNQGRTRTKTYSGCQIS